MKVTYLPKEILQETSEPFTGPVKVTTCGNVIETMKMSKVNRKGPKIHQLGGGLYVLQSDIDRETGEITGEIKEFNRTENRGQNLYGLSKSMKDLRDLINCNVTDPAKVRWMTFTYAENMTDNKQLYRDRQKFWQRVQYWHVKQSLPVPEYISIVEPQGRGAWHLHELWLYPDKAPFLPNATIADLWQQGFVTVKKLDDVDNVGAYLTAYLCDVPLDECRAAGIDPTVFEVKECEVTGDDGEKLTKKYVKGARVHLYPAKMNFYRTSRGVKRPEVEWVSEKEAKEKVSSAKLTYEKAVRLTDDEKGFRSDILYEYYNKIRKENQ